MHSRARLLALLLALPLAGCTLLAPAAGAQTGAIDGVAWDSLEHHPLAGALVQIVHAPPEQVVYTATTDSLGSFHLRNVRVGGYVAGVFHPLLDSLGVGAPYRAVTVPEGGTVQLMLAVPSAQRLADAICATTPTAGAPSAGDATGMLVGHVRDAITGSPAVGSLVAAVWPILVLDARGVRRETRQLHGSTNADGWFALCGLDPGDYAVRAELGTRRTGFMDVSLHPHDVARISLVLGADSESAVATPSTRPAGRATLSGVVTTAAGHPLEGAQVMVEGSAARATTDARGTFSLGGLLDGTRMAEARALGYAPVRVAVEPARNERQTVAIVMDTKVNTLGAMTIYGAPGIKLRDLSGFVERQRRGFGRFLTRADIDRAHALSVCDLLRRVVGLHVEDGGTPGCQASLRGACEPTVYMDNSPFGGSVAEFVRSVSPRDIMGIEVYTTATEPLQFSGGCGSIVVWSRE